MRTKRVRAHSDVGRMKENTELQLLGSEWNEARGRCAGLFLSLVRDPTLHLWVLRSSERERQYQLDYCAIIETCQTCQSTFFHAICNQKYLWETKGSPQLRINQNQFQLGSVA